MGRMVDDLFIFSVLVQANKSGTAGHKKAAHRARHFDC
jgi:hypothetical protein